MYPKVKVRAAELEDDDYDSPGSQLRNFESLSIRDYSPEKESKHHASSLTIAKVPRSYVPRSITPPPALPRATKKSEQEAEDGCKPHIRASSIPRPRAVISSPDNDQILGSKNKKRLERPSPLTNHNMAQSRHSTPRRHSENRRTPIITARKTSTRTAESRETVHISDAKGKQGSGVDIRVPRANIVKAKPCFTIT